MTADLGMAGQIEFRLNGVMVTVGPEVAATTTLLHWLRGPAGLCGTKEGCAEGDCGACTIVIEERDGGRNAVNACLLAVGQVHGASVRTIEGIRGSAVQHAFAEGEATQCGFCTPGFVMAAWAHQREGGDVHEALAGNLCRCTGYRPIVDVVGALADDGEAARAMPDVGGAVFEGEGCRFHRPMEMGALLAARAAEPGAWLLAGGTDLGVGLAEGQNPATVICLSGVAELARIETGRDGIRVGAAAPYARLLREIEAAGLGALRPLLARLGSRQIRGLGTLGGNLGTASPIGDMLPPLLALGATVRLRSVAGAREMAVEDFLLGYRRTALRDDEIIESVFLPRPAEGAVLACERTIQAARPGHLDGIGRDGGGAKGRSVAAARIRGHGADGAAGAAGGGGAGGVVAGGGGAGGGRARRGFRAADGLAGQCGLSAAGGAGAVAAVVVAGGAAGSGGGSAGAVMDGGLRVAGRAIAHDSALKHCTGEARFLDDLPEPLGTLHAAFVLAGVAHGRLVSIDAAAALDLAGVVAVLTAADIPGLNDIAPTGQGEALLATDVVEHAGQPVAIVVGRNRAAAAAGAAAVVLRIEALPPVLTIEAALETESLLFPPMILAEGDVETALGTAPHRLHGEFRCGGQEHFYLEGQVALAAPGEDRDLVIHSSTQHPTEVQHIAARVLGCDFNRVTVQVRRVGGGFGGKESNASAVAAAAAVAAVRTGRPVKLRLSRKADIASTGKRHPFLFRWEAGFDGEGRVLALDALLAADGGHTPDLSGGVMMRALTHALNACHVADVRLRGVACKTNHVSNTAFRGFGGPQGVLLMEDVLCRVAPAVGKTVEAVRACNFAGGDNPATTPYGASLEGDLIRRVWAEAQAGSEWERRRGEIDAFNAAHPFLRRGLGSFVLAFGISFGLPHLNQAGALVHVYTDGSVRLNHGGTEMGQGLFIKVAQVVAEVFGIGLERIAITATSTGEVPNTSPTAASTGSDLNGAAAHAAASAIRDRMAGVAAAMWVVNEAEVAFADDRVTAGNHSLGFGELADLAYRARVSLSATGYYRTPDLTWDGAAMKGRPFFYYSYGASVAEVAVDTLTGENRVLRADLVQDCGRSLNPAIDRGQIEGAFVQGLGWLTCEELWSDPAGRLRTLGPSTYKIPGSRDVPPVFNVRMLEGRAGPGGDHFPVQGGGGAAAVAGDRGVERVERRDRDGPAGSAGHAGAGVGGDRASVGGAGFVATPGIERLGAGLAELLLDRGEAVGVGAGDLLVEDGVVEAAGGGILTAGGIDDAVDAGPVQRAEAHRAGLAARVDGAAAQVEAVERGAGGADGDDLGVGGGVLGGGDAVHALGDDGAVLDDDGAERAALRLDGVAGEADRPAHELRQGRRSRRSHWARGRWGGSGRRARGRGIDRCRVRPGRGHPA